MINGLYCSKSKNGEKLIVIMAGEGIPTFMLSPHPYQSCCNKKMMSKVRELMPNFS